MENKFFHFSLPIWYLTKSLKTLNELNLVSVNSGQYSNIWNISSSISAERTVATVGEFVTDHAHLFSDNWGVYYSGKFSISGWMFWDISRFICSFVTMSIKTWKF